MINTQGLIVFTDSTSKRAKRVLLPAKGETREFKTPPDASYVILNTHVYGQPEQRWCQGCEYSNNERHTGNCGTGDFSNLLEVGGEVWKVNEEKSLTSPHNIYEQREAKSVQHLIGILNIPIICTRIILDRPIRLCKRDGTPYDMSEMTTNGNCIEANEGYVFRLITEFFGTEIIVMKRVD